MADPDVLQPGEVADWGRCPSWRLDWKWAAPPPGETLREHLDETGETVEDLARKCDLEGDVIEAILGNTAEINPEIAGHLSRGTGPSAQFWLNLQNLSNTCPYR